MLAWREFEGEVVIISPEDSVAHALNPTAAFIWNLLDGEHTIAEIAEELVEEFEVTLASALADTKELIACLQEKRLLLLSPAVEGTNRG
jgi:methyltransferase-like protein